MLWTKVLPIKHGENFQSPKNVKVPETNFVDNGEMPQVKIVKQDVFKEDPNFGSDLPNESPRQGANKSVSETNFVDKGVMVKNVKVPVPEINRFCFQKRSPGRSMVPTRLPK